VTPASGWDGALLALGRASDGGGVEIADPVAD
jgi:hypothetical protein